MNISDIERLLLRQFPYNPTEGQKKFILKLSQFLIDFEKPSLFILKGYAGTGKTTVVSALVQMLSLLGKQSVLLAPTGRAAKVLAAYSGHQAFTIHKKIYQPRVASDGSIIMTLAQNTHSNTLFIVDEASMIQNDNPNDFSLFSQRNVLDDLFSYVSQGRNCKLLLIGDTAQLPPVGLSISPALDTAYLKNAYHITIELHELTEVVRQAHDSGILYNATLLRKKIKTTAATPPFFSVSSFDDVVEINGVDFEDLLNKAYSTHGWSDVVVICRSNKRANMYNQEIRRRILYQDSEITAGDLLMVVKNSYFWLPPDSHAGFIANGDIIEIMRIRRIYEMYEFRFADVLVRMLDYPDEKEFDTRILLDTLTSESPSLSSDDNRRFFSIVMEDYADMEKRSSRVEQVKNNPYYNALQVKFAYALTCHKTQGGQWNTVFIDQGYVRDEMINVEFMRWLYTALTRAKEKVYLVNFNDKFFSR
ncbi:MAG: AAA family ATPase [Bacteroidetes bacterium]|nr:AAA family ATPase [Bacteroidota bacterium]